jgi:hypothetical protein
MNHWQLLVLKQLPRKLGGFEIEVFFTSTAEECFTRSGFRVAVTGLRAKRPNCQGAVCEQLRPPVI